MEDKKNQQSCSIDPCMCICLPCLGCFVIVEQCFKTYFCLFCCCTDIHKNSSKNKVSQEIY